MGFPCPVAVFRKRLVCAPVHLLELAAFGRMLELPPACGPVAGYVALLSAFFAVMQQPAAVHPA
jgi:hypothetical protein